MDKAMITSKGEALIRFTDKARVTSEGKVMSLLKGQAMISAKWAKSGKPEQHPRVMTLW